MQENNMTKGLVSIIMPAFNQADLVIEMVKSIQGNTYQNWELFIVDDGSSAEDYEKISGYAACDSRISVTRREILPKGAPTCRNIGFSMAHGEYCCFFDSDDFITKECLEQRIQFIQERPELDFAIFPTGILENNKFIYFRPLKVFGYEIFPDDLREFLSRALPFIVCSNIYRTEALKSKGITWDTQLKSLQDGDFNVQSILNGMNYAYSAESADYFYRLDGSPNTISKKIASDEHFNSNLYSLRKNYATIQQRYGATYNQALFRGVQFLYNQLFTNGFNRERAISFCALVSEFDRCRGLLLKIETFSILLFKKILPYHVVLKISMLDYFVWRSVHTRKKNKELIRILKSVGKL